MTIDERFSLRPGRGLFSLVLRIHRHQTMRVRKALLSDERSVAERRTKMRALDVSSPAHVSESPPACGPYALAFECARSHCHLDATLAFSERITLR